jgi:TolB-like protein
MKAKILTIIYIFTVFYVFGQGRDSLTIDESIRATAIYLSEQIPTGTKVAIVNISASQEISDYVISELTSQLVNNRKFIIVDRQSMALIEREMRFQLSGEVSDESAQAIGRRLGAQTIISGSLTPFGNSYRMQIKALEVETGRIQGIITYSIRRDRVINNLTPGQLAATKQPKPKTTGGKIGTGVLNIVFGLGSYLESDIAGGLILTGGYAVTAGLFLVEAFLMDWDNPAVGIPGTIGFSAAGLTLAYGFLRPFSYNRSSRGLAILDNTRLEIVPVGENIGIKLAYTVRF